MAGIFCGHHAVERGAGLDAPPPRSAALWALTAPALTAILQLRDGQENDVGSACLSRRVSFEGSTVALANENQSTTRFAREKYDHFALRAHLKSLGMSMR